jgi:transposase
MYFVGLDVHAKRSSLCIVDQGGRTVNRREVRGSWPKLLEEVAASVPRPFAVCYEASCGYGYLHAQLSRLAERVAVAHPGKLRLIWGDKRKNDRVDAQKLAKLLCLDAVPAVHVPPENVRAWRGLIEARRRLVDRRVAVKAKLRALLRGAGICGADAPSGKRLWSRRGLTWLASAELCEADALQRELLLEELTQVQQRIARLTAELDARAAKHPGVALLRSIPGVGVRTAEAVVAYLDDVRRFARIKQVGCYFGLVPCQDASAGRDRLGHITGDGPPTVRKLLCESAWQAVRRSPALRAYFEQVTRGDAGRRKLALVATAHKLARIMAAMLRSGEAWRE